MEGAGLGSYQVGRRWGACAFKKGRALYQGVELNPMWAGPKNELLYVGVAYPLGAWLSPWVGVAEPIGGRGLAFHLPTPTWGPLLGGGA